MRSEKIVLAAAIVLGAFPALEATKHHRVTRVDRPIYNYVHRPIYNMVVPAPSRDVVLWLGGYYNGKRNNTIIEPLAIKKDADQINLYCLQNRDTTVMDAVKNVLDFDK